jgi:hypothetical protein
MVPGALGVLVEPGHRAAAGCSIATKELRVTNGGTDAFSAAATNSVRHDENGAPEPDARPSEVFRRLVEAKTSSTNGSDRVIRSIFMGRAGRRDIRRAWVKAEPSSHSWTARLPSDSKPAGVVWRCRCDCAGTAIEEIYDKIRCECSVPCDVVARMGIVSQRLQTKSYLLIQSPIHRLTF